MDWTIVSAILPAFFASIVECVEAMTIVLAVGMTINWKSSLWGAFAGAALLIAIVLVFGQAIMQIPIDLLRIIIGIILLLFGMLWMKKAILRYSGYKDLRDEEELYRQKVEALKASGENFHSKFNGFGAFTAFKGVVLEGLEVAFIVLSFSAASTTSAATGLTYAALGALAAVVLVSLVAIVARKPLSMVPENTLKFCVGFTIAAFGTYWAGEALHIEWPLHALSIVILAIFYLVVSVGIISLLKSRRAAKLGGAQ